MFLLCVLSSPVVLLYTVCGLNRNSDRNEKAKTSNFTMYYKVQMKVVKKKAKKCSHGGFRHVLQWFNNIHD